MSCPTPISDFVRRYADKNGVRAHMPGHKGHGPLGFEHLDITEIKGADALYEADGIIAESESIASSLFGTGGTYYSTEGSSQCIRAMLLLAATAEGAGKYILAGRNVHKAFVYACGLLGLDAQWLMGEGADSSICRCAVTADEVRRALEKAGSLPAAVYLTSPDYLGGMSDIRAVSDVCHNFKVPLIIDNAHGAYLRFLPKSLHPIDLGADMCCDSAHKTLPVLTGGAYLHISRGFMEKLTKSPKQALALFGSTSPSYLILQSLDECNKYISSGYPERLAETCRGVERLKKSLADMGYNIAESDPLKLTVFDGAGGETLAERLRGDGIECEFADKNAVVLMLTPENALGDFEKTEACFAKYSSQSGGMASLPSLQYPERAMSMRAALMAPSEKIAVNDAVGRVCADPSVSCPPAVPVAVSGEIISKEAAGILAACGIEKIEVVK